VKDAAQILNVSVALVYSLVDRRRIPHLRLGCEQGSGAIRFDADILREWLRTQIMAGGSCSSPRGVP
jgi:excisionase family DNA binding protein